MKTGDFIIKFDLYNPQGGAILGQQDHMDVYLYDVALIDAVESYALLNGEFNDQPYKSVKIGDVSNIEIHSYIAQGEIKLSGDDIFFLGVIDQSWNLVKNNYNYGNNYKTNL